MLARLNGRERHRGLALWETNWEHGYVRLHVWLSWAFMLAKVFGIVARYLGAEVSGMAVVATWRMRWLYTCLGNSVRLVPGSYVTAQWTA